MNKNTRIVKNTAFLYIRMMFILAVNLYTSRIVLNALGIVDYGIYNVVGGIVIMFSFLNGAMTSSTSRYITFYLNKKTKSQLQQVFSMALNIHLLIAIIVILLGESIGLWFLYEKMQIPESRFFAAKCLYQLSIASIIVLIISVPYNAVIIAHEKMEAFAYISILNVILKLSIAFLIQIVNADKLFIYGLLLFLVQIIDRIVCGFYASKHFDESHYIFYWNKRLFKEMSGFAGWSLFGNAAAVAYTQGLNILLNIFFGPAVNASRAIAVQVQGVVSQFTQNFQTALNPQIVKSYANNEMGRMHTLIYASSKYSFFLLLFISLPLLLEAKQVLIIWLNILPEYAVCFFRIIMITCIIDSMSNALIIGASATGKIRKYQIVIGGILLLILPVSYITLKLGAAPESVFFVHLLIVIIAQFVRLWLIRPMIALSIKEYFDCVIKKIVFVSIFSVTPLLGIYLSMSSSFLRLVIICICSILFTGVGIYYWGLNKTERSILENKLALVWTKIKS